MKAFHRQTYEYCNCVHSCLLFNYYFPLQSWPVEQAVKLVAASAKRETRGAIRGRQAFFCTLRPATPSALLAVPVLLVRTRVRAETWLHYLNMYRCFAFQDAPQMLSYVELCLNKTLSPIDCMNSTAQCDYNKPVQYPPIVPLDSVI